jgi:hypothetical protein
VELVTRPLTDVALARCIYKHTQPVRSTTHELAEVNGAVAVHIPEQKTPHTSSQPTAAVVMHALAEAIHQPVFVLANVFVVVRPDSATPAAFLQHQLLSARMQRHAG